MRDRVASISFCPSLRKIQWTARALTVNARHSLTHYRYHTCQFGCYSAAAGGKGNWGGLTSLVFLPGINYYRRLPLSDRDTIASDILEYKAFFSFFTFFVLFRCGGGWWSFWWSLAFFTVKPLDHTNDCATGIIP